MFPRTQTEHSSHWGAVFFVFVRDVTHVQTCEKKCFVFRIFGSDLKHVQTCDDVRVQSATQSTASVHTWNISKPVMTFVFKVLRNGLLWCILGTCPNLWWRSCSKCNAIDCVGTCLKHVQTCDDVRVQSATQSTASVQSWNMSKPVMTFVFKVLRNRLLRCSLETCPNLWWRSCSKCYATNFFGTCLKHVQTCDDVRVQSATQSTASVQKKKKQEEKKKCAWERPNVENLGPWSWFRARATKDPKRCLGNIYRGRNPPQLS